MEFKEKAERIIEDCRNIQGDLYRQIEKVEYSINLLNEKKSSLFVLPKTKTKITELVRSLKSYKTLLEENANYIDVKFSVLTKESQKPDATIESMNKLNQYKYSKEKTISLPKEVAQDLAKFGINFSKDDEVRLCPNQAEESELCM